MTLSAPASPPVYGTDFSVPLSETMTKLRAQVNSVRGQLTDIGMAYPGWKEELAPLEGGLTCILIAMFYTLDRMKENEALRALAARVPE